MDCFLRTKTPEHDFKSDLARSSATGEGTTPPALHDIIQYRGDNYSIPAEQGRTVSRQLDFTLCAILSLVAIGLAFWIHVWRSNNLLQTWVKRNKFELVSKQNCWRFSVPLASGRGQTIYFVTVKDERGSLRSGWVRCGGIFLGLNSNKVEVRWYDG
jgi:hypothetical protein